MKRFKNILCYFNKKDDKVALRMAFHLAKENQAKLTLIDIADHLPPECDYEVPSTDKRKSTPPLHCQEYLDMVIKPYQNQGVPIKTQIVKGIPIIKLVKAVKKSRYDLVVTSTIGLPLRGLFWDSMALKLIRKCPVPVWIIRSQAGKTFKHILAAVDLAEDKKTKALNKKIMEMASSLALMHQGHLTVVHGWQAERELNLITWHSPIDKDEYKRIKTEMKKAKTEQLHELVKLYHRKGLTITAKLVENKGALAIVDTAEEIKADLTVMGTVHRTGIAGLLMGSTAEEALPLLKSSLLAIKPEGFQSPIV